MKVRCTILRLNHTLYRGGHGSRRQKIAPNTKPHGFGGIICRNSLSSGRLPAIVQGGNEAIKNKGTGVLKCNSHSIVSVAYGYCIDCQPHMNLMERTYISTSGVKLKFVTRAKYARINTRYRSGSSSLHSGIFQSIRILELPRILILHIVSNISSAPRKGTYLPHINSNLTTFSYNTWGILAGHPLFKMRQYLRRSDPSERLRCLMSHHVRFGRILQNFE